MSSFDSYVEAQQGDTPKSDPDSTKRSRDINDESQQPPEKKRKVASPESEHKGESTENTTSTPKKKKTQSKKKGQAATPALPLHEQLSDMKVF